VDNEIFSKICGELCDEGDAATCEAQGKNSDFRRNNTASFGIREFVNVKTVYVK
jgi:hypothetical protein